MRKSTFLKNARAADYLQLMTAVYLLINILYILPFYAVYVFSALSGARELLPAVYIYLMTLAVYDTLKLGYFNIAFAAGFSVLYITQYTANRRLRMFVFSMVTAAADTAVNVLWVIFSIPMVETVAGYS